MGRHRRFCRRECHGICRSLSLSMCRSPRYARPLNDEGCVFLNSSQGGIFCSSEQLLLAARSNVSPLCLTSALAACSGSVPYSRRDRYERSGDTGPVLKGRLRDSRVNYRRGCENHIVDSTMNTAVEKSLLCCLASCLSPRWYGQSSGP